MKTRERPDLTTPAQRRWLDRYAQTCPSRHNFFITTGGSLLKKIKTGKHAFHYGGYGMSITDQWKWIKKEVRNWERRERIRIANEVEMNKGSHI